jgi:hypothetical protein
METDKAWHSISMMLKIQVLAWDSHKNVMWLYQLMGSEPSPLDN